MCVFLFKCCARSRGVVVFVLCACVLFVRSYKICVVRLLLLFFFIMINKILFLCLYVFIVFSCFLFIVVCSLCLVRVIVFLLLLMRFCA